MSDSNDSVALLRDYLKSHYRIGLAEGELTLRIGENVAHPSLETGLPFAFMTAWNPRSMAQPRAANEAAQRGLDELLAKAGATLYPAVGGDPSGTWQEGSVFAVGVPLETADQLATQFEQNAIVAGRIGEPARLRVYRVEWKKALEQSGAESSALDTSLIDWVASPPAASPPAH